MGPGIEKLMLRYKKPVIMHVADSMTSSGCFTRVCAAVSQNSPAAARCLDDSGIDIINTPGLGYAHDLSSVLLRLDGPVMVVPGDMPHLDAQVIQMVSSMYGSHTWTSIVASREFAESHGIIMEYGLTVGQRECAYTGVSLVNASAIHGLCDVPETQVILDDVRIAFSINTGEDYRSLGTA